MEWYYAEGNQPRGPVTEEEFESLVGSGAVKPETLVWRAGMPNWKTYGAVMAEATAAPGSGGLVCGGCGQVFPLEQVTRRGDAWVCGECRSLPGPGLVEAALPTGGEARGGVSAAELLAQDYAVEAGECFNRSWQLLSAHAALLVGASVLVYLVLLGSGMIPFIGSIASLVVGGPLLGGLWLLYLRRIRGEDVSAGDAFCGFGPDFGQLLLGYVIPSLLSYLCLLPFGVALVGFGVALGAVREQDGLAAVSGGVGVIAGLLALVGLVGAIYLTVSWFFTLPLILDKRMRFWPAMVLSRRRVAQHFWGTLLLLAFAWLLLMAGALLCGVGLLLTGPLAKGMVAYHYETVFGELRPGSD